MEILDTIKSVAGLAKKIGDIELYSQIIDLQTEVFSLIEENHKLRMELNAVDDVKEIERNLEVKENAYYLRKGETLDGPFCTACWDKNNKLIRYHLVETDINFNYGNCPVCKTSSYYVGKV